MSIRAAIRLRRAVTALSITALAVGLSTVAAPAGAAGTASTTSAGVVIPNGERPHRQPTEWWYFSGHLHGSNSSGQPRDYGYEYVIFQFLEPGTKAVYIGNFAVTDHAGKTFRYSAQVDSYAVPRTPGSFDLRAGDWTMQGADGTDELHAQLPGYAIGLHLQTTKPAALHGAGGVIPFGPFGTSKYYSWTSLATTGTIVDHGEAIRVSGSSWMDHQWGAFNFASRAGWDWFSIQLSGDRQYMLYFIRDASGAIVQTVGTLIAADGTVTHLPVAAFAEQTTGSWTSPATGITYGSGWRLTVPGGHLTVTPRQLDQELDLRAVQGVAYWEGDVRVRGKIDGRTVSGAGYTEVNPPNAP